MNNYLLALLFLFVFVLSAFGQIKDEIDGKARVVPYDHIDATFGLDTATTAQDVGFDDPKGSWKFSYELRLLNDHNIISELQKRIYAKYGSTGDKAKWVPKANLEIEKEIKKLGVAISKGKLKRTMLESEDNRVVVIPVKLTPEIQQVLGDSSMTKQNPEFIITVKGKVSTRTATKIKFKGKYEEQFECPVKTASTDGKTYWSLNRCGVLIEAARDDGKISFDDISKL